MCNIINHKTKTKNTFILFNDIKTIKPHHYSGDSAARDRWLPGLGQVRNVSGAR